MDDDDKALTFLIDLRFGPDLRRREPGTVGRFAGVEVVDLGFDSGYRIGGTDYPSTREASAALLELDRRAS